MNTKEISDKLNVTEETVRRWIRSGELQATIVGKTYSVNADDLDDLIKRKQNDSSTSIGKLAKYTNLCNQIEEEEQLGNIEHHIEMLRFKRKELELKFQLDLLEIDREILRCEQLKRT